MLVIRPGTTTDPASAFTQYSFCLNHHGRFCVKDSSQQPSGSSSITNRHDMSDIQRQDHVLYFFASEKIKFCKCTLTINIEFQ